MCLKHFAPKHIFATTYKLNKNEFLQNKSHLPLRPKQYATYNPRSSDSPHILSQGSQ